MKTQSRIAALRIAAYAALSARDAIDNCSSPEWRSAHVKGTVCFAAVDAELNRLLSDPATRYGAWRTDADKELQMKGYYDGRTVQS